MSKMRGNVLNPNDAIDEYGTDALRFAVTTGTSPGMISISARTGWKRGATLPTRCGMLPGLSFTALKLIR